MNLSKPQIECNMEWIVASLAITNLITGLIAAVYWLRGSRIVPLPFWAQFGQIEPVNREAANESWIVAQLQAASDSGRLNAIAAIWTAVAVIVGCLATLATLHPQLFG